MDNLTRVYPCTSKAGLYFDYVCPQRMEGEDNATGEGDMMGLPSEKVIKHFAQKFRLVLIF